MYFLFDQGQKRRVQYSAVVTIFSAGTIFSTITDHIWLTCCKLPGIQALCSIPVCPVFLVLESPQSPNFFLFLYYTPTYIHTVHTFCLQKILFSVGSQIQERYQINCSPKRDTAQSRSRSTFIKDIIYSENCVYIQYYIYTHFIYRQSPGYKPEKSCMFAFKLNLYRIYGT